MTRDPRRRLPGDDRTKGNGDVRAASVTLIPAGRRTKWAVLVFWLVLVAVAGPLSGKLTGAEKNDTASWLPSNAQSTQVLNLRSQVVSPNVFAAVVIYDRPSGLTAADKAKVAVDIAEFGRVNGALKGQVTGPAPSADGQAAQVIVPVNLGSGGYNAASPAADSLRSIASSGANGMSVHVTGPLGFAADSGNAFKGIDGTLLFAALAVVIVLLLITYRSPVLWLLPVISAGVALVTAQAVIYLLAKHAGLTVNAQSAGILDVLVFGAGTDYALLLTARYREELRRHENRHAAMAVALRRAGPAIVASAGTVIISLLTLSLADLNSTKSMGPVLAIGVAVSLLSMMTLLPALLVITGRWVFWPAKAGYGSDEPTTRGLWARVGNTISARPRVVWIATAVVLGAIAVAGTGLQAHGLTNAQSFRGHPDSVAGQTVLDQHFAGGAGQPAQVFGSPSSGPQLAAALRSVDGLTAVTKPVTVVGHSYLEATLTGAPDSQAAYDTVTRARAATAAVPGADAIVGGNSAVNLDVQQAAAHDRTLIIPIILAVVFVILVLLLRALIAPIMLMATVVLSFGTALGISALFFNHVFNFDAADTSFPLFLFVFLVALGIDYNIFLMTRVREESARQGPRRGALTGLSVTGGVITSAGAVLAGTFAVLSTLPVTFLTEIGFAVAVGVLLDTIIVRSVLVTALNLDLGRWVWWPSRLSRAAGPPPAEELPASETAGRRPG
jgi:RND superfamily putative drug exporter